MKNDNRHGRLLLAATLAAIVAACGTRGDKTSGDNRPDNSVQELEGDSMVYGLACDGSNDSILLLLPLTGEDPDTFDILDAWRERKVFGRPATGDNMAVMVNREDSKVADLVVDLDRLKGDWRYLVKPHLRHHANTDQESLSPEAKESLDSVLAQIAQPREFGMEIKSEHIVRPIGMSSDRTPEKNGRVQFPPQKRYRMWYLFNGKLLLSETRRDTAGVSTVTSTDTAQLVMLRRDSLVLRFSDGTEQGYYRSGK